MRAIVINLKRAPERMAFQAGQLDMLGIPHERFEAVDASAAPALRPEAYWNTWERPLRDSEKACFLSHWLVWQKIAGADSPMLVLEDDAVLSDQVAPLLRRLVNAQNLDMVNLEIRGRKKLVAKEIGITDAAPIRRLYQDRNGSAAYILWPSGAQKLLSRTEKRSGLADAIISSTYELKAYQADPALAIQIDRCRHYGIEEPLDTSSSISVTGQHSPIKKNEARPLVFKLRRIGSQIRMGLRQAIKSHLAVRREIELDKPGFRYLQDLKRPD